MAVTVYVKSGSGVVQYVNAQAWSAGNKMVPALTDSVGNFQNGRKWVWECTTPGTTNGLITWPAGAVTQDVTTITQNGVVFTARKPGYSSGTTFSWSFATPYYDYASSHLAVGGTGLGTNNGGDMILLSNLHAESRTSISSPWLGSMGCHVLSVDDSNPANLLAGASISVGGAFFIGIGDAAGAGASLGGHTYWYGINFTSGSGGAGSDLNLYACIMDSCTVTINNTGGTFIVLREGAYTVNCGFKFNQTTQSFKLGFQSTSTGTFSTDGFESPQMVNTTILAASATPATLFFGTTFKVDGLDCSVLANSLVLHGGNSSVGSAVIKNAKMPSGWTGSLAGAGILLQQNCFDLINYTLSGGASTNYGFKRVHRQGSMIPETTIVRTGGATDGTTATSWKLVMVTDALLPNAFLSRRFTAPDMAKWNTIVGVPVVVNVHFTHDSATPMTDAEIYVEVSYPGSSSFPSTAVASDACGVISAPQNQAASTAVWADGAFSNPNRQKCSVQITPQQAGLIVARVRCAKSGKTLYICPKLDIVAA